MRKKRKRNKEKRNVKRTERNKQKNERWKRLNICFLMVIMLLCHEDML